MRTQVRVESNDGWATIELDRSDKRNALSHELVDQLIEALDEATESDRRVVVLAAAGPVFCAGGDRAEIHTTPVASDRLLEHLATTTAFVVARVEAPTYGAGLSVLASCPVVIGGAQARFALPEAAMGNFPVPVAHLEATVPARRLLDVALRGTSLSAEDALASGFVTAVGADHDEVDRLVDEWVTALVERPTVTDQARRYWQARIAASVPERDAALRRLVTAEVRS